MKKTMINVLDKGYVRLVDSMGSDLSVVNAARASFHKESEELTDKDQRLIRYLWRHRHTSPFRHAFMTLEVKAPLEVARQWWKHVVGSASIEEGTNWNEISRRYVTGDLEWYIPVAWREAPANKKQGSGDWLPEDESNLWSQALEKHLSLSVYLYEKALEGGIAPEVARLFLPAYGMYVHWRWTASLQAIAHFMELRLGEGAQWEIRQYSDAVGQIAREIFPVCIAAMLGEENRDAPVVEQNI